jgi:hypothetical protein
LATKLAGVDLVVDVEDRHAGLLLAVGEHPEARHDAAVGGQDRPVNVQTSELGQRDEWRLKDLGTAD